MTRETVRVELGTRGYDIHIGGGLLADAGRLILDTVGKRRAFVITDERVAALHLDTVKASLDAAGILGGRAIVLPPGERTKDFGFLERLVEDLLSRGLERSDCLIALGGGVIGDLTGFAAAVALRGIDFVQIPTTLLAQVDSSVGGKTGINTRQGKNLVGAFHQPRLVLADIDALATLPRREILAGYAEIAKYGLINDPGFFDWLETHGSDLVAGDTAARRHAVAVSCRAKAAIVAADERESGARALLNLGHTFGHALEAECGYGGDLLHGEAVAIGMCLAFDLSARRGLCPAADADRVRRHLRAVGLPTDLDAIPGRRWDAEALLAHMKRDKKVKDGRTTFVLANGIGKAFLARDVDGPEVVAVLRSAMAA